MTHHETYHEPAPAERVIVERERPTYVEPAVARPSPADFARRLVTLLFGILQALIILRIVLLLLGANEANDLVAFVVGITGPFVEPFRGMFRLDAIDGASGTVLDIAAVVALVAWTLLEALVLGIVGLTDRRTTTA